MKETKLTFIADLHYYSKTLGTTGRAYELRSGSDQKCLGETSAIIDAAFSKIKNSDTDAVLILGDISNNGERVSHEELRQKLYELKKSKPVYLITATHDWCSDENPRRFEGYNTYHDVPVMKSNELRDFYADFGPEGALDEFITHLGTSSCTVDVGENVRILCLNDDQNGKGRAGYTEEHFQWIEQQIKKGREEDKFLIGMEHHLLIPHISNMFLSRACVGDREEVASRLADAGLHYMFVGHSHIQAIDSFTSEKGNKIIEINVGSLCGYPSPIVNVTINDMGMHIETTHAEKFEYEGKVYDTLPYVEKHSLMLLDNILIAAQTDKNDFADRLAALGIKSDKSALVYAFAHPLVAYLRRLTVGEGYKKLRLFGLGKYFDKALMEEYRNKPVLDFVHELYLSFLDGGRDKHLPSSSYYRVVMNFMGVLVKIKDGDITRTLHNFVKAVLDGSEYDINGCTLPNLYK